MMAVGETTPAVKDWPVPAVKTNLEAEATWVNVAVTADAPFMVIVVEAEVELAKVTDPVGDALHAENE